MPDLKPVSTRSALLTLLLGAEVPRLTTRELVAAAAEILGQSERDLSHLDERTGSFVDRVIEVLQRLGGAAIDPADAAGAFDMTYAHAAGVSTTAGERYFEIGRAHV